MDKPRRVQLSRKKGWRMPENTVKVDRSTKWGNPHDWRSWLDDARICSFHLPTPEARECWAKECAVDAFREDARDGLLPDPTPLKGKNLACWCRLNDRHTCHADVLLELANRPAQHDNEVG